jgi:hypothetical protein
VLILKSAGRAARRFFKGAALRRRRGAVDLLVALLSGVCQQLGGWRIARYGQMLRQSQARAGQAS